MQVSCYTLILVARLLLRRKLLIIREELEKGSDGPRKELMSWLQQVEWEENEAQGQDLRLSVKQLTTCTLYSLKLVVCWVVHWAQRLRSGLRR